LWLGIQLGIAGHGIEAVENHWAHWSNQSKPAVTASKLFAGREESRGSLKNSIQQREPLISIMADSQSEAVAFVCALLIEEGYSPRAACVTSEEGWQFVDANPGIDLVVITDNRLGNRRSPREGISLYNSRGVTSRMPYDGGKQERKVSDEFRRFSTHWKDSKPNLAAMIEDLAKSYELDARRQDEDGLWAQEW